MNRKISKKPHKTVTCQIIVEASNCDSSIVLQPEYASPEEAIGSISSELLRAGKSLTYNEILLVLIVKMKLSSGEVQHAILREAMMLITNRSFI